ncbi:hypothetical protein [Hylemonella gracilis]|uniref:hypothetical protein n=1 Tax=Hylemonella gracilis TaxID=80880 RepID=UPI0011107E2E|nr:hypothetical protein [Hylemonella gracilis]
MEPEAFFDTLRIADVLDKPLGGVSRMEIQRISFLSCLLSIYQAKPVSDWGYRFANTGAGTPFSDQLNEAVGHLLNQALLTESGSRLRITVSGRVMLAMLSKFDSMAERPPCLEAACASMLAVPRSTMSDGLDQEPTIAASHLRSSATMLLEEPHLSMLHEHFSVLAQVIPPSQGDLLSPSVLWLSYMAQSKWSEQERSEQGEAHA